MPASRNRPPADPPRDDRRPGPGTRGPWQVVDPSALRRGAVVGPLQRLSWPVTAGIGLQHVVAMFGATFLVPLLTGFPPSTTLFFSGVGTLIFLLLTGGRVPSYLGSSFAFIAPILASQEKLGLGAALGGIVAAGVALALVGLVVQRAGTRWLDALMPPVVTGTIVALIGLNLAPSAKQNFMEAPLTGLVTLAGILLSSVLFKGLLGRLSIMVGVAAGYVAALFQGQVDFGPVSQAAWVGLPEFQTPEFHPQMWGLFLPVVLVLVAENVGHVKSVALMTGTDLDPLAGRALMADGVATALAGAGGGSGTTTYAENIGVMAATRVYSSAAYVVAGATALLLSLSPKFGALIATVPPGVLGGAATVLYGMIGLLGVRMFVEHKVDFSDTVNLSTAAVALIVGIADYTWAFGEMEFAGIALGTASALVVHHGMRALSRMRAAGPESP